MPQISSKNSPGVELLEIIQMEPLNKFNRNHNGNAKGGVKDGNSWRRSHTGNMSEQDVDDVAFLTGPDSQSSRLARERAGYGGSASGGGRAVAVCSQRRALILALMVLVALLTAALVLAYAGPQAECGCAGTPPAGSRRGGGKASTTPQPRLAVGGASYPWPGARLPPFAEPHRYTLLLHPNLTTHEIKGEVWIEFHMEKESNFIVINSRDLNITDKMINGPKGHVMKIVKFLEFKPADQVYIEVKEKFRRKANYTLSLRYNTKLTHKAKGFFLSNYVNSQGEKKMLAATNFGLTHARSAFPCFDEPHLKARFKITIVRDRFHVSLTNMPIAATEEAGFYLGHRLLQDDFQESPEMSTYVVGMVVCEFSRAVAKAPRGASISVYADKAQLDKAQTILDSAVTIIDRYESFLNVSFPLPKLDMVIMEGLEETAEGWGLLGIGSQLLPDKERLERLLAHQWLGGLVTPKWWGSRWLTEGLVSLLQHAPSGPTSPEDDTMLLEHTVPALRLDALPTAHPVSMSVQDPEDIEAVQDELSYHKGAALVGMAWSAAGAGARTALRDFLSQHARSAADPRDLWRLLGRRARADLQVVMESWTEQAGYPLVTLHRDGDLITVKQERFLLTAEVPQTNMSLLIPSLRELEVSFGIINETDLENTTLSSNGTSSDNSTTTTTTTTTPSPPPPPPKEPQSKANRKYRYRWYVPLTYTLGPAINTSNTSDSDKGKQQNKDGNTSQATMTRFANNQTKLIWMNMTEVKFRVPQEVAWIKLNAGGRGLYRANYPEKEWTALSEALKSGALPSAGDRASLIDDAFTLSRAGLLNASAALRLCEYLSSGKEQSRAPWRAALQHLNRWAAMLAGAAAGAPLKHHVAKHIISPALKDFFHSADRELVEAAVEFELPDAVKSARKLFDDWMLKNISIAPDIRQAVYSAGVRHGDEAAWMRCWRAYRTSEDPSDRHDLLNALATTSDHWLLNRYLQATLDPKLVSAHEAHVVLSAASRRQPGRLLAWRHLRTRPSAPPPELLLAVAEHMSGADDYKEVSEFYQDQDIGPALNRSLETIALNVAWVGRSEADILKYLANFSTDD